MKCKDCANPKCIFPVLKEKDKSLQSGSYAHNCIGFQPKEKKQKQSSRLENGL